MSDLEWLRALPTDGDQRQRYVESLRMAASILENRAGHWGFHLDTGIGQSTPGAEGAMAFAACKTARELRDLAQRLCDHARGDGDGCCRYCEVRFAEPG